MYRNCEIFQFLNDLISIDFFYREGESILIEQHLTTVGFISKTIIICPYPRYVKFHTDFVGSHFPAVQICEISNLRISNLDGTLMFIWMGS